VNTLKIILRRHGSLVEVSHFAPSTLKIMEQDFYAKKSIPKDTFL
jgi:hypothetical protein